MGRDQSPHMARGYAVTVTISMPDGTDQLATTQITDDSTDRYIGRVTATALHLRRQRREMQRRMDEEEARS